MHSVLSLALAVAALPALINAQQSAWGQCGGNNWNGATSCVSGYYCSKLNDYYSQCIPGTASTTTTTSGVPTTTTTTSSAPTSSNTICPGSRTKFKYFGINESGAEFGNNVIPGTLGTDYTWPTTDSIDFFLGKGMNTFRVTFLMERLSPPAGGLTGTFDPTYLASLKQTASYITGKGGYAVIDPHNFGRYNGNIMTDYTSFGTWCKNLASQFKSDTNIIFDTNNEYHDMDQTLVFNLNQACINGIRAAGATNQLILIEGNSYTGAWTWVSSGNAASLINLTDPNNNLAYEMHQYLDSDGSGTSPTCVSSTIGAERLAAATAWLQANNKKGFLGEIGAGSNDACITAVQGALCSMQESGVWIGALWWAAGPWWGTYYQSIEPPDGAAIARILPEALLPFL
ncbi:endoglucanase [Sphaerosporella brunnea]|uniref:cellulase n=1 Tax=Sphaerosporella brunnea TaxID=1250544 RepID=A0A5J5EXP1_9PEZI|nr:endoglucanase [Sphaerosporella brunnea]